MWSKPNVVVGPFAENCSKYIAFNINSSSIIDAYDMTEKRSLNKII